MLLNKNVKSGRSEKIYRNVIVFLLETGYDEKRNGGTALNRLTQKFERFCLRNKNRGIPNLMLWIAIGNAAVYILSMIDPSLLLVRLFSFSRGHILAGEVWRLITFILVPAVPSGIFGTLMLCLLFFFYYRIGKLLEQSIGVFKFNLFYFTGVLLLDAAGLLGMYVSADSLHYSLLLAFAATYSDAQVLLFYFIPIRVKYLAWFYIALIAYQMILMRSLLPLIPLVNFLIFFWAALPNLLPESAKVRFRQRSGVRRARPSPNWADGYRSKTGQKPYRHKCTVCGRTDTEYPTLEFRYCSRCKGYHCYCMDHINAHTHIT